MTEPKTASERYWNELAGLLRTVAETQGEAIEAAARACADALGRGGMLYTFGTGHSHLLAEEIFYRAGGLAAVYPIFDDPLLLTHAARSSFMERLPGYAELLLDDVRPIPGSVLFVFSNSGRNTVSVDMAMLARARGLTTVCITNRKHADSVASRHPSGKKLHEVCDIVIDNCGRVGDACVELYGRKSGATSTAVGAAVLQAVTCRTVELCGGAAEVYVSGNADGGDEINARYIEKYKGVIKPL